MAFFDDGSLFGDSLSSLLGNGSPSMGGDGLAGAFGNPSATPGGAPAQLAPGAGPMPEQGPPMPPGGIPPNIPPVDPATFAAGSPNGTGTSVPSAFGAPGVPQSGPMPTPAPPGQTPDNWGGTAQPPAPPQAPPTPVNPPPGGPSGSASPGGGNVGTGGAYSSTPGGWTPRTPPPRIPTGVGPVSAPSTAPPGMAPPQTPPSGAPAGAAIKPQPQSWLARAFGSDPQANREMVGMLAKGLQSVSQNWNKPAGAAFAAGMGGAFEGALKAGDTGTEQQRKLTDTAIKAAEFKERQYRNDQMYDVYMQRLQQAQQRGTPQSRAQAWEQSDMGRLNKADVEARAAESRIDAEYAPYLRNDANAGGNGADLRKEIEGKKADARGEIYKRYNVDPSKADTIRNRGNPMFGQDGSLDMDKTKSNAHQPKSWDEFNATVKPGQYFVNPSDGKLYKRQTQAPAPLSPQESQTIQAGPPQLQAPQSPVEFPENGSSTNFASAA